MGPSQSFLRCCYYRQVLVLHLLFVVDFARCAFVSTGLQRPLLNQIHQTGIKSIRHNTHLHGIKGFRTWFESAFPSSMVTFDAPRREFTIKGNKKIPVPPKIDAKNRNSLPQMYDHVLIDANQYLHSTLRRAYNRTIKKRLKNETIDWEHGLDEDTLELSLVFLFRELDDLLQSIAIPRKSVVIALDGAPGAAKMDTQRDRRFSIYRKAETQRKQISILKERGWTDSDFGITSASNVKGIENIIFAKHDREQISLNISPGTYYMDRVTQTLLYWAWMAMSKRDWPIAKLDGKPSSGVKIYISPSDVAGEGEVKLIDWLMHGHHNSTKTKPHVKMGDSVAVVGGDSDLVLMGLVVPSRITHDINILLPRELNKTSFYLASVRECTKMLSKYVSGEKIYGDLSLKRSTVNANIDKISLDAMSSVKMDIVLLVIMNGNDYLPKLRGVIGGFDPFFMQYFKLIKAELQGDKGAGSLFLLGKDNDGTLSINVPFALAFFRRLLKHEPREIKRVVYENEVNDNSQSQLEILINLCESKMLPYPLEITRIYREESYFESELSRMNAKLRSETKQSILEVYGKHVEIVRLTLGNYPFDDASNMPKLKTTVLGKSDGHGVVSRMISDEKNEGRSYLFEVPHRRGEPVRDTKHRLACLALEEIFGKENMNLFGNDDTDTETDSEDAEEKTRVNADVASYLGGLLWTLQTYQQGYSPDWSYNYGQRVCAPAGFEIVEFLERKSNEGVVHLRRTDLMKDTKIPPLPAGLTCAAALPTQAWRLVPEPYSKVWLPEEFEEMYQSCVEPDTVFNMAKFQKKCTAAMKRAKKEGLLESNSGSTNPSESRRNIYTSTKHWTVISRTKTPLQHPFTPPKPYTSRAFALRPNRRIKATKLLTTTTPSQSNHKSKIKDSSQKNALS